jgi:hypothetical protein
MPLAFSTNSGVDSLIATRVPAAISAACSALSRLANSLNALHSSALVSTSGGCHTPQPVIEVPVVVVRDIGRSCAHPLGDVHSRRRAPGAS